VSAAEELPVADLTTNFAGIRVPQSLLARIGAAANCGDQVMRAFDAGWGGAVWETIGEPIVKRELALLLGRLEGPAHDGAEQYRDDQRPPHRNQPREITA
jgi:hypothetical protein